MEIFGHLVGRAEVQPFDSFEEFELFFRHQSTDYVNGKVTLLPKITIYIRDEPDIIENKVFDLGGVRLREYEDVISLGR